MSEIKNPLVITGAEHYEITPANISAAYSHSAHSHSKPAAIIDGIAALVKKESRDYDMTVKKDRDACASLAHKVTRSRTLLEKFGVKQVKELKDSVANQVLAVNNTKQLFVEKLNSLREDIRKPLNDWEDMRDAWNRKMAAIEGLAGAGLTALSPDKIKFRMAELAGFQTEANVPKDLIHDYLSVCNVTQTTLTGAFDIAVQREEDAAELATLRKQQAERAEGEIQNAPVGIAEQGPEPSKEINWPGGDPKPDADPEVTLVRGAEIASNMEERRRGINNLIVQKMLITCPISESGAKAVVAAILRGQIPNITITY